MSVEAREAAVGRVQEEMRAVVHRAKRVIGTRAHAVHPALQGASYLLLGWLTGREPLRASAIVEALGSDKGALSRQLQHLEELGLVERTPDPSDRRATLVSVTADARLRLAEIDDHEARRLCERLAEWSVGDLDDLADRIARYNRALAEIGENAVVSPPVTTYR
ncbi:MAG TPA: MarR family transcriptional regulator [Nocardioides sp.]|nr:MarR family transcriptional regulator [Nocardioides sp.]